MIEKEFLDQVEGMNPRHENGYQINNHFTKILTGEEYQTYLLMKDGEIIGLATRYLFEEHGSTSQDIICCYDGDPRVFDFRLISESGVHFTFFIIKNKECNKGYSFYFLKGILKILFNQYGVTRLNLGCFLDNLRVIKFFKDHGFVRAASSCIKYKIYLFFL